MHFRVQSIAAIQGFHCDLLKSKKPLYEHPELQQHEENYGPYTRTHTHTHPHTLGIKYVRTYELNTTCPNEKLPK